MFKRLKKILEQGGTFIPGIKTDAQGLKLVEDVTQSLAELPDPWGDLQEGAILFLDDAMYYVEQHAFDRAKKEARQAARKRHPTDAEARRADFSAWRKVAEPEFKRRFAKLLKERRQRALATPRGKLKAKERADKRRYFNFLDEQDRLADIKRREEDAREEARQKEEDKQAWIDFINERKRLYRLADRIKAGTSSEADFEEYRKDPWMDSSAFERDYEKPEWWAARGIPYPFNDLELRNKGT